MSDMPIVASGVAIQTRYIIEGLIKTGKYRFRSLGGAMKHENYQPIRLQEYGDDWIIYPVDGYGSQQVIRDVIDSEKFDAVWFMTDPRFYYWFFSIIDELQERHMPVLYNHVWDEKPTPHYNRPYYLMCDFIGCISKLTYEIISDVGMADKAMYIPHAVDSEVFKPLPAEQRRSLRTKHIGVENIDKFVCFYNSRNARRKMTADVILSFKKLLDRVGKDKAFLFMHTNPKDEEGPDLVAVTEMLGLDPTQIRFSTQGLPPQTISEFYNMSDVLINISNNEGFGLSCLEALSCGTLAVVNKTGGLQDQIYNDEGTELGVCVEPVSKSLQGSQHIPYIFDCRVSDEHVADALEKLYKMPKDEREKLQKKAREWTLKRFSMDQLITAWDKAFEFYIDQFRSEEHRSLKVATL